MAPPAGIPGDYGEHIRLLCDLVVLAFQADVTRVATFVLANEGSNKPYPFIGVPEGHHDLSHHGGNPEKQAKIRSINLFHAGHVAHLLQRLDAVPEEDGTLLDHAMIVYGSGIHDGNKHNHEDLPILLAGGGCGTITTGPPAMPTWCGSTSAGRRLRTWHEPFYPLPVCASPVHPPCLSRSG
jgi:hypothetical protein